MKVVVDSNIIISLFLSPHSPKWDILRELDQPISPRFLKLEIREKWNIIEQKSAFSPTELLHVKDELLNRLITFVEIEDIGDEARQRAFDLCREVDMKDIPFIALTIDITGVLWTNDEKLKNGLKKQFFHMFLEPDLETRHFEEYLKASDSITGQPLIRAARIHNDGVGIIQYWEDFEEYSRDKPGSRMTQEIFNSYFGTGDQIAKILMRDSVRVLRNIPSLRAIQISIPYKETIHTIEMSRTQAEEYFNIDLLELGHSPKKWRNFVDSQVYSKKHRQDFLERFEIKDRW